MEAEQKRAIGTVLGSAAVYAAATFLGHHPDAIAVPLIAPAAFAAIEFVRDLCPHVAHGSLHALTSRREGARAIHNRDLDRVAKMAVLAGLHETLSGTKMRKSAVERAVRMAGIIWDQRPEGWIDPLTAPGIVVPASDGAKAEFFFRDARDWVVHLLDNNYSDVCEDAANDLSMHFVERFVHLVRNDQAANNALMFYIAHHQTDLLREIRELSLEHSRDFRDLAAALENPQPPLDLFDRFQGTHRFVSDKGHSVTDLIFKSRVVEYMPRAEILQQIEDHIEPEGLRIVGITGPAGLGKSRLGLELADAMHDRGWLAGFLPKDADWSARGWGPLRDTLLVIDYASGKQIGGQTVGQALVSMLSTEAELAGRRIVVVLLDRLENTGLTSSLRTLDEWPMIAERTLNIELQPDRDEFDILLRGEYRRIKGCDLPASFDGRLSGLYERLRGQFRPLFALLAARAVAASDKFNADDWDPELLAAAVLHPEIRKLEAAGVEDSDLWLLFDSTITQDAISGDETFKERARRLSAGTATALFSLSSEKDRVAPILPDLLGEYFVWRRLAGDMQIGRREPAVAEEAERRCREYFADPLYRDTALEFVGRMADDYDVRDLTWMPDIIIELVADGVSGYPLGVAVYGLMGRKLIDSDNFMSALSSAAPESRRWPLIAAAAAFMNATVVEPDPAKCLAIADRIRLLHDDFGAEPAVREQLARALMNATVGVPDPAKRLAIADRIRLLHDDFCAEPAVRELLAKALMSATVVEPDPAKRLAIAGRIQLLHDNFGAEPAVREPLAGALMNATVDEPDPAKRLAIADRIRLLHDEFGAEPAVREQLAKALMSATVVEPDPAKCLAIADRIRLLHDDFGAEPAVREQLAKALMSATVVEPDPAKCLAIADRIQLLHDKYGAEPAVREQLIRALMNATVDEPDPKRRFEITERIGVLRGVSDKSQ